LKFRSDELAHFMGNKGMSRKEYCIAVPMLFSIYEGTNEYKKNKEFRDIILVQKKVSEEIVAGYTAAFKKQKELDEVLEKAKEKAIQSQEALYEKIKDQLMLEPNNEDIKKMIRDIIALEKQYNIYDEEYWEDILHLL
jgi:hemoglobin-like flavoprotein